jgi:hypothetical protein
MNNKHRPGYRGSRNDAFHGTGVPKGLENAKNRRAFVSAHKLQQPATPASKISRLAYGYARLLTGKISTS